MQKTPLDEYADLVIHSMIDTVIDLLMKKLNIPIPQFKLDRWMKVELEVSKSGKETLHAYGVDKLGGPYDLFKAINIDGSLGAHSVLSEAQMKNENHLVQLSFQGHYNENKVQLKIPRKLLKNNGNVLKINMICDPYARD